MAPGARQRKLRKKFYTFLFLNEASILGGFYLLSSEHFVTDTLKFLENFKNM